MGLKLQTEPWTQARRPNGAINRRTIERRCSAERREVIRFEPDNPPRRQNKRRSTDL